MSMDPAMIQQMLAQKLQQGPASAMAGGGSGGPQMQSQTSPFNAAATITQKLMLMKALQNQAQGGGSPLQQMRVNAMQPAINQQLANDPAIQALQQQPLPQLDPDAIAAQIQIAPPGAGPTQ